MQEVVPPIDVISGSLTASTECMQETLNYITRFSPDGACDYLNLAASIVLDDCETTSEFECCQILARPTALRSC